MHRSNDLLVGAVVLAVALGVSGATLWVKQADIGRHRDRVVARFHDVGNARVGNTVVIRGVRAGQIESISLARGGWVHLSMSLDPAVELPRDPVVLLNESSLFGEWQATITPRSALPRDETVLRQVAEASGGGDVLPGATLPDIAKLTAVAGQIAGDVANVSQRVEVAFDEQAARELRASIRNFADMSSTLARTVHEHRDDLDTLSRALQSAVTTLNRTAVSSAHMAELMDSSTSSGQIRQMMDDMAQAAAELRRSSTQLRVMSEQLGRTQGRLDAFLANGDSVFVKINHGQGSLGLLVNDAALYRHSDSLTLQLRDLVSDLRANPKKYVSVRIF
ncbi:MAG TPA: MlaD family protein [Gemmatimonadaceae bacterium]|nr:MlaD family protein [Gemmatimonadaceae bacterium]